MAAKATGNAAEGRCAFLGNSIRKDPAAAAGGASLPAGASSGGSTWSAVVRRVAGEGLAACGMVCLKTMGVCLGALLLCLPASAGAVGSTGVSSRLVLDLGPAAAAGGRRSGTAAFGLAAALKTLPLAGFEIGAKVIFCLGGVAAPTSGSAGFPALEIPGGGFAATPAALPPAGPPSLALAQAAPTADPSS